MLLIHSDTCSDEHSQLYTFHNELIVVQYGMMHTRVDVIVSLQRAAVRNTCVLMSSASSNHGYATAIPTAQTAPMKTTAVGSATSQL